MQTGMRDGWLRVAHRGASGSAPEHTREAFSRALAIGVDMIELDVQLSADDELVVIHDFDLERTTNGRGSVRSHTLAALRELDAGQWFAPEFGGERILTLSDVLDLIGDRAQLNVEVKPTPGDDELIAAKLTRLLQRFNKLESTLVSCFDFQVLRCVRSFDATLPLGLLTHDPDLGSLWQAASELRAYSVHPHWALVTPELIGGADEAGLKVITWTVNDVGVMEELLRRGVSGIISDHPELFAAIDARLD